MFIRTRSPNGGSQLLERTDEAFGGAAEKAEAEGPNIKDLHAKIGQLTLERDFLEGALSKAELLIGKK